MKLTPQDAATLLQILDEKKQKTISDTNSDGHTTTYTRDQLAKIAQQQTKSV